MIGPHLPTTLKNLQDGAPDGGTLDAWGFGCAKDPIGEKAIPHPIPPMLGAYLPRRQHRLTERPKTIYQRR